MAAKAEAMDGIMHDKWLIHVAHLYGMDAESEAGLCPVDVSYHFYNGSKQLRCRRHMARDLNTGSRINMSHGRVKL
jgi:hypothetical protein